MKIHNFSKLLLVLGTLLSQTTFSSEIDTSALRQSQSYSWQSFHNLVPTAQSQSYIFLLKWNDSLQNPPPPPVPYQREVHFKGWLSIKDDRSCLDVRNRVLIRDSLRGVQLKPDNPCKVQSGVWYDPYTDRTFTNPTDLGIDHFVPLKNAYINGAWRWSPQQRCLYANYMGFDDHLKAVLQRENGIKGEKDPSRYMPPNRKYRCDYLKRWLAIKLIWKLSLHVEEAQAIRRLVQTERCNPQEFVFTQQELRNQRQKIQNLLPICSFTNPNSMVH